MTEILETDVLVVGGGGAGFRSAIGASTKNVSVTLLSKGPLGRCGATPMAGADFTLDGKSMSEIEGLAGDVNDSKEKVLNDIVTQGWYLNNQKLVEQYVQRAPQCLQELIEWGITIKVSDERMVFTSGTGIMDALLKKARASGVNFLEDIMAIELITHNGKIAGVQALEIRSGRFIYFKTKAVVLATGGWHKGFSPNTGMRDLSGEGIAMAQRAGASLGNMEFITFCCNVFYAPLMWRGSIAPYILSLICGGRLTNSDGKDILSEHDSFLVEKGTLTEWNKSFISYITAKETRAGKGLENGGIHYSRGDVPWENIDLVASIIFPKWKYKALDLSSWQQMLEKNEPVEVGPAVEYFDGGIVVNDRFETNIEGLYAAGECTLGAFGANRVFAAITEMLVQGADAGAHAGGYAAGAEFVRPSEEQIKSLREEAEQPLFRREGESPPKLRKQVQEEAHRNLGPIRTHDELNSFLSFLDGVKMNHMPLLTTVSKNRIYNKEWIEALELKNMIQLLESAAQSALARTESRGVHFREDYPNVDNDHWMQESIVRLDNGTLQVNKRPVTVSSMTPPKGKTPYLDFMKQMMAAHSDTGGKH